MWKIILISCLICTSFSDANYIRNKPGLYKEELTSFVYDNNQYNRIYPYPYQQQHGTTQYHPRYQTFYYFQQQLQLSHTQHHHQPAQQPIQHQPIFPGRANSQVPKTEISQTSENSITEYYTGCPVGHTGLLPYAYDCRCFLNCWNGRGHIQTCSVGTMFNPAILNCDHLGEIKCETPVGQCDDTKCLPNASGLYPHPHDCFKFVECSNGATYIKECPFGTAFDSVRLFCDHTYNVKCCSGCDLRDSVTETRVLTTERNMGQGPRKHCAAGLIYDANRGICYEPNNAKDISLETPVPSGDFKIYCPFGSVGLFPHPFNNNKYLKCVYGRLYEKSCRPEFIYNLYEKSCEKYQGELNESLPFVQKNYSQELKIENDGSYTFLKCPADLEGNFLYPFNCRYYINCSPQRGTMRVICPPGEMFNYQQQTCQPESYMNKHVECWDLPINDEVEEVYSSPIGVCCKHERNSQRYPHPDNWHKYVYCDNFKLKIQWCPLQQVFNPERQKCIDAEKMLENN